MLLPVGLDRQNSRWRKLTDPFQNRKRRRHHSVPAHVVVQRGWIDAGIHIARFQERRKRRGEPQMTCASRIIEGLYAEPIAREDDSAGVPLPNGECKHAEETLDALCSPSRISLQDDFGVASGKEAVSFRNQLGTQLSVIIDAAVKCHGESEFGIDHRLLRCRGKIENAESTMAQAHAVLEKNPAAVRPTIDKWA